MAAELHESVCYVRYAVTAEEEKRHAAANALRHWLDSKREVAGQVFGAAPAVSERWFHARKSPAAAAHISNVAAGVMSR